MILINLLPFVLENITMKTFRSTDYKVLLRERIEHSGERGVITKLAEAAGCQRSYLSQVLNTHVHLTPDQALGVAEFFGFNEDETTYFLALVDHARASSPALRARLKRICDSLRKKHEDLESRLETPVIQASEQDLVYYSTWVPAAVHIAVSIPDLQTPAALAHHLQLPEALIEATLHTLEQMQLVKRKGTRWVYAGAERHLSKRSALVPLHHSNWRQRAIVSSQAQVTDAYHYTGISSVSRQDYQEIKDRLLEVTEKIRIQISSSREEELVCLNIDFFRS
jgi:uncharacterized protein (TIGR02147 family)